MQTKRRHEVDIFTPAEVDKLAGKMPAELRASVVLAGWCGPYGGARHQSCTEGT
jgi:hypothetical protein